MKLDTPREPFLQHLQLAASICPTRSPRPIVQDVMVEVSGNTITLLATDGEISVRTSYTDDGVSGSGRIALPAATLLSAVRALPSDEIHIVEAGNLHEIKGGSALFKLHGDDPDLFPSIPTVDLDKAVSMPISAFADLCERTMFAAAKDMGRYAFNGVLLEMGPDEVTMVATDGRRLSMARMDCKTGLKERRSSILPLKGLIQLQRAAADGAKELRVDLRENQVTFALEGTDIIAQLLEGEFPDFRAVLPAEKDTPLEAQLNREELASAIRRAAVTAGDQGRSVELSFTSGRLCISSHQEGVGESRSEMDVQYDGDEVDIRFNPEFLGEYLKTLPEGDVTFRFKDRSSAGLFRASEDSLYVVMPITS
ncbi:MAG: DNA polymerase III subunit beta [Planctomycetota bacterium]|jgi:DNA polymerase-3 subunit beta